MSELISRVRLDFAVVVTTNPSHEEIDIEVLNAGINIIVEKSTTLTYQSAKKMIGTVKKKTVI